eukprot:4145626-Pyramimonas_sp.AAC.1
MQRYEFRLILQLGLPNYSYFSSHLEVLSIYARNLGCRRALVGPPGRGGQCDNLTRRASLS